ncbi:RNA guanine-N7 methyltransferase activating subunit [Eurosta solidaginis]|uniref:RNA guanine-N7 methyltransferase activating subunit n=1 Tax=Eurosta solidaginis TaxID=178769 RepID=UPI003530D899
MVDPNRKINRLTEKDIEFLDECQEEFENRFTKHDEEFALHCSKPLPDPPIIENWGFSGTGNSYRGGGQRNNYGGNRYTRGGWNKRGRDRGYRGGGGGNQSYRNNYRHFNNRNPYDRNQRRENEQEEPKREPINIRRDYGNFVRASKE